MAECSPPLQLALTRIVEARETFTRGEARELLNCLLGLSLPGETENLRVVALVAALAARGETTEELAGFVDAMRSHLIPVPLTETERAGVVDTCGTGGDLSGTFNISTGAALVAAAAGATVAKHGNRAVTSRSGSADVLQALGIPVALSPDEAAEALRRHRFAFLAAPSYQPAMRKLMPIRRAMGVRTVFNILGPLSNPAGAPAQVIGVYAAALVPRVAETLATLGTRHSLVVHGCGMDEFALAGPTEVAEVKGSEVVYSRFHPADAGLPEAPLAALAGADAEENAAILTAIFAGEVGPCRDVVVLNAGAVLLTSGLAPDLRAGVWMAQQAIDRGAVTLLVSALSYGG